MEELLNQFMGQMENRFEQMEERMDARFEQMEKRFDQVDARFEQIDNRFEQMDKRFDTVEQDIRSLTEEVRHNQTENRSHFKHVEAKLEQQQQQTFEVVVEEIKGIKIDINYLNQKVGKHDMEINNLHQRLQA